MSEACRSRRIPALKDLNEVKDHVQTGEDRHVVTVKEIKALVKLLRISINALYRLER